MQFWPHFLAALAALALLPLAALAQSVTALPPMSVITFKAGSNQSTMTGQSVPGGRDLYYVKAKAGQTMSVSITSAAANITFQIYNPETTVARAADGSTLVTGKTLPDAAGSGNAQAWVGSAPGAPLPPTPYSLTVSLQ